MAKKVFTIKTKYGFYKCIFEPEPDMGGYMVEARGVSGAISWGKTLSEAKKMIAESIEGAIEAEAIINAINKGIVQFKNDKSSIATV